jgi:hypothetical protein
MVLDTLFLYPEADWLFWTDSDVYLHTGWLYLNLDVYLADVPADKVL